MYGYTDWEGQVNAVMLRHWSGPVFVWCSVAVEWLCQAYGHSGTPLKELKWRHLSNKDTPHLQSPELGYTYMYIYSVLYNTPLEEVNTSLMKNIIT